MDNIRNTFECDSARREVNSVFLPPPSPSPPLPYIIFGPSVKKGDAALEGRRSTEDIQCPKKTPLHSRLNRAWITLLPTVEGDGKGSGKRSPLDQVLGGRGGRATPTPVSLTNTHAFKYFEQGNAQLLLYFKPEI